MMSRVHHPWNPSTFPQHLINALIPLEDHHRGRHVHLPRGPLPFPCYLMELPMPPAHHQLRHVHIRRCPQSLSCHPVDSLIPHVDHHLWRLVYSSQWLPQDSINAQLPSVDHHLRCHTHFLRCPSTLSTEYHGYVNTLCGPSPEKLHPPRLTYSFEHLNSYRTLLFQSNAIVMLGNAFLNFTCGHLTAKVYIRIVLADLINLL